MTGTDHSKIAAPANEAGPVIILIQPQMGENIGAAARAMMNCGLNRLRLVRPRDGWPNEKANANAAGALELMPAVEIFDSTAAAVADLQHVYATTARPRDMVKRVMTARGAAEDMHQRHAAGESVGILFGPERSGLENADVAFAGTVITIPLNPGFSSLNLAQAVLLAAYEWRTAGDNTPAQQLSTGDSPPAPQAAMSELYARLERELDEGGFFRAPDMRPTVVRNIQAMLTRAGMTEQEVNTFHGIISSLRGRRDKG